MDLHTFKQFQPMTITGLDINMTRKQPCELDKCNAKSFSRFGIVSQQYHMNPKYVCCSCASNITTYNFFQLGHAEEYVQSVKPHFKQLKEKVHFRGITNHNNPDVTGKLIQTIGDLRIMITEFNGRRYGLMINRTPYHPSLRKGFSSYKKVYNFTVRKINNIYSDRILNFIYYGNPFIMP